ncbi:MAG: hypothetical protein AVDCRST_MAG85-3183 [uncultured Solirubrobacteraceae bacterium]|uniref:Uncharacterized protein n=1 Tax=uncultured Solirubrobacteraceae bacterium TaxID=1162706 RepID=A0A6J4TJ92_9ACTN|nr:MAG: hypothetical protein AVDCRST_MAG85-3183 [uncultured Solirubrobacteraceae bacterium]
MPAEVAGADALTSIFGEWPSFHDAEVLRMRLDRGGPRTRAHVEADVHVFAMTSEVDEAGFSVLRDHTLVTLRFDGIAELELGGFNDQNALFALELEDITDRQLDVLRWSIRFDSSHGVGATFLCEDVSVLAAGADTPEPLPGSPTGTQSPPRPGPYEPDG